MAESTELEAQQGAELEVTPEQEALLARRVKAKVDKKNLVLPIVKLGQSTTEEVKAQKAKAGEFINSVTGHNYGSEFDFVIADTFQGRFYRAKGGQAFVAGPGQTVAPDHWPPEYAGQPFVEIPDAEEQFFAAANAGEREFGGGPPISTSFNYVGYIIGESFPEEVAESRLLPVRLSLMRTSASAAKTIDTLLTIWPTPWDRKIKVEAVPDKNDEGAYFRVEVSEGEKTDTIERSAAVNLAVTAEKANIELAGDEGLDDKPSAKVETAGMEVD